MPQTLVEGPIVARGGDAVRFEDAAARLDSRLPFIAEPDAAFGAPVQFNDVARLSADQGELRQEAWFAGDGFTDRLRVTTTGELRRADGSPAPPRALDPVAFSGESYDVTYTRGWTAAKGRTASGLEVSLTPHAGFGVGSDGPSAEAGATLRIGENLDRLAPNGDEAFGERPRWYLYAAGSKRAVGYNFARTRDGDFARSGVSQDAGSYLGDASIGVAYRRGSVQSSFGVVYREIEAKGLRGYQGIRTDVSEGLVAFQLTIRPPR
ncbi:lipid A-modifier LpxR family protein [Brevundimonas diminuta]